MVVATKIVPAFESRGPLFCGSDTARFLTETKGIRFVNPHPGRPGILNPTFSGRIQYPFLDTMADFLHHNGGAKIHQVSHKNRLIWLREGILFGGQVPALFVRSKPGTPLLLHWVAIAGFDGDTFYGYDSRKGNAHDPNLPIGNVQWTGQEVEAFWKGLSRYSVAVTFRK